MTLPDVQTHTDEEESLEDSKIYVSQNDPDFFEKMKMIYFTNIRPDEDHNKSPILNMVDEIMKEPYRKIKIKNLYNFKAKPLEDFDPEIHKEYPHLMIKKGILTEGFSRYMSESGKLEWRSCEIMSYDETNRLFKIKWKHDGTFKKVTRLNLKFGGDREHNFEERLQNALENRYKCLYLKSYDGKL
jgi:hypothetical protein